MMKTDDQLKNTQAALAELEKAMAALTRKKSEIQRDRFMMMAEPMLAQISQLRSEIDAYTGIAEAEANMQEFAESQK